MSQEPPNPSDDLPAPPVRALAWDGDWRSGRLLILDQTLLPAEERTLDRRTVDQVVDDIRRLAVRGAPALGVAAAYALVLAARAAAAGAERPRFRARLAEAADRLRKARPTAVNLARAVDRSLAAVATTAVPEDATAGLFRAARALEAYEVAACAAIGRFGAERLKGLRRILTHCNAGALVTPGLGTALAPIYVKRHRGEPVHVWVDETRPLLQGLRLTAYELAKAGVSHAVLVEGAAPSLMARGEVDAVIVGADRVCRNGDVVNKIGTFGVALAARRHRVPFLVAAPLTTLDPSAASGDAVPLEQRPDDPAAYLRPGTTPVGATLYAPAFDVTPADLVTALVTDLGVVEAPTAASLAGWMAEAPSRG